MIINTLIPIDQPIVSFAMVPTDVALIIFPPDFLQALEYPVVRNGLQVVLCLLLAISLEVMRHGAKPGTREASALA
jgi:hypothetical protein